jgi:hypothetical protein
MPLRIADRTSLLVGLVFAAVFAAAPGSAAGATYLHGGTSTGNLLASGTAISSPLQAGTTATWTVPPGSYGCSESTYAATVGPSGGATVSAATTSWTFSSCWETIAGVTLTGCEAPTPLTAAIAASASTVSFTWPSLVIDCHWDASVCRSTTTNAVASYASAALALSNLTAVLTGWGVWCGMTGTFNARYLPLKVTSGPYTGTNVVVNTTP